MLQSIERLLSLQERDRKLAHLQDELSTVGPQRQALHTQAESASARLEAAKNKLRHLESDRKRLELEVEAKKQLIERYSLQQFQTKKNEEYRALAHEIDQCKAEIVKIEDHELELMEQAEQVQKEVESTSGLVQQIRKDTDKQSADLRARELELQRYLEELTQGREALAALVDGDLLPRYERLRRTKGERVLVGIEHAVCGGCHMKLPAQIVISCQAAQEILNCPNCGRILYHTPDMDLVAAE